MSVGDAIGLAIVSFLAGFDACIWLFIFMDRRR